MKRTKADRDSVIHALTRVAVSLALVALGSCSKLSHVGDNNEPAPHAVATTIGESYTRDGNGNLQTTVRAGSEVVLTGKDSEKGDNDTGVPLVNFKWEQVLSGGTPVAPVQLIARTSNTVSFTAPQVTVSTQLTFKLTVSDVKGNAATTQAVITVLPIRDQDHFLQYLNVSNTIPVTLATQSAIVADTSASATATLPVSVTITKLVTFPDRNDSTVTHTRVAVGTPVTISTGWTTKLGSSTSCTGNENPTIQVAVPRLNLDDLLPAGAFPDAVVLSDILEPADIDKATLEVRIDVSSGNSTVTASTPLACINNATAASGSVFTTESLLANASPRDSKVAAQAYYATIDPTSSKDTLNKWLNANGFNASVSGWNADTHAVYTNNYDLGFGRDMYMKIGGATGKCDNGTSALPLDVNNVGKCDVAAVVVNYSGVEAAAKKLNPVVAVAMEYSAPSSGGARIVKFYTFTPDTRTGDYTRVSSVNLDRRGEQFMPQACVVCHGGTPGTATNGQYSNGGDVKAGFLAWDLDSLLYSDTDPGFSSKSRDAALRTQYTRSAQEAQLKLLNTGAYLTFADPAAIPGRYSLMREMVEGWYHGSSTTGLPATSFDGAFVPEGWKPTGVDGVANTSDDNPSDSASIYSNVFARNCRMCHTLQVPATGDPRSSTVTVSGTSIAACTNDARLANSRVGTSFQVPMGCYWEFAHAPNLADRLARNQMPFARRTSDRTWVNSSGSQTAGSLLQAHLLSTQSVTVATPGTASTCVDTTLGTPVQSQGTTKYQVNRDVWVSPTMACSRFIDMPLWTLSAPAGSNAVLVGADTATPRFVTDKQGDYSLTLSDGAAASVTAIAQVPVVAPIAVDGNVSIALGSGGTGSQLIDATSLAGYSPQRDALASISIISVTGGVNAVTQGTSGLNITANSLAGGTVTYQLADVDGDVSNNATITVAVSASLSISQTPTISVASNSTGNVVTLSNYVSNPAGQPLTFTILSQPTLSRSLTFDDNWNDVTNRQTQSSTTGAATLTNSTTGAMTYDAPPHVLTHFGSTLVGSNDSFTYKACFVAAPATCTATGTVSINLTSASNQSFYNLSQGLAAACGGCHGAAQTGANLVISATFNGSSYDPPAQGSAGSKSFYCALRGLSIIGGAGNEPANTPYMSLSSLSSSLLYRKPQSGSVNGGGSYPTELNHGGDVVATAPLTAILNWINEGAYFTEGSSSSQSCP